MDRRDQAVKAFIAVRDELYRTKQMHAFRLSYKKPYKFYLEHSKEGAIAILLNEARKRLHS